MTFSTTSPAGAAPAAPAADDAGALLDGERQLALIRRLLDDARRRGADAAEVSLGAGLGLSVQVRMGEVEQLTQHRDRALSITVYRGDSSGSASTADWREPSLRAAVEAALAGARHTAPDPANGLADPQRLADPRALPDLALDHPWTLDPEAAITLALACETAARDRDARIVNSDGAGVASVRQLRAYGNSHGFLGAYLGTRHSLSCGAIAADPAAPDRRQRGSWYTVARDPAALESAGSVGVKAAERALARLGVRPLATATVPVVFAPEVARGLLGHLVDAVSGSALYRDASFLRGRAGERIFPDSVQLSERPHLPGGLGSEPFDGDGVATADRELVDAGVLTGYVLGSYSARRLGLSTTGNAGGIHNLLLRPGAGGDLLATLGRGLLVTQLMGQGVNLVSGDYSRGAAGFWIENGEIRYPVEEITLAGNLAEMYRRIVAVGDDIDSRGVIRCGSLLIDSMVLGGR